MAVPPNRSFDIMLNSEQVQIIIQALAASKPEPKSETETLLHMLQDDLIPRPTYEQVLADPTLKPTMNGLCL